MNKSKKKVMILIGTLIKFSEYLKNPKKHKGYEKEMIKYAQDHLVPYTSTNKLISYVIEALHYLNNTFKKEIEDLYNND